MRRDPFFLSLCLCAAFVARVCNASSTEIVAASCLQLQTAHIASKVIGLPTRGARITHVEAINGTTGSYCQADGEIASVDPAAQNIKFEMAFPFSWNGKMIQLGGGGLDGEVVSPTRPNSIVRPLVMVERGYLVYGSDSGHAGAGDDSSFALNEEQLRNYAGDQIKKTHDVALALAKELYGTAPGQSYIVGGSAGGRESFTAVQKYGSDYDAALSYFPGYNLMPLTLKFLLVDLAMQKNGGAGRLGPAEADLVERAELAACDKDDGLEGGIIGSPSTCQLNFATLRCPNGAGSGKNCLTEAQLATLQLMHSHQHVEVTFADGTHTLPAYDIGAALGYFYRNIATGVDGFVKYFIMRNPNADPSSLDPYLLGNTRVRIETLSAQFDRASANVDTFVTKRGKWILVQGLADELVPSEHATQYYNAVVQRYGQEKTNGFLKLYLIPGYAHGHGAPFDANYGPFFDALERWAQGGDAPATLTTVDQSPQGGGRTRPSCLYPALPRYNGSGDPNDAGSFSCAVNRPTVPPARG
jgi:Tannase and feruloyl esterase